MDSAGAPQAVAAADLLAAATAARAAGDVNTMRIALVAAFDAARTVGDVHAMAEAALAMPTSQQFGVHPGQIPALLHEVYLLADDPTTRCRLAAALARSWVYGGDAARAALFAADAQRLAEQVGTAEASADALDAALVAHWGPDDFTERVSLAARLEDVAAHVRDPDLRLTAHLWRLTTAWECLDIIAVQRQLRALDAVAEESGSERASFFATSRRAMHALAVGDVREAEPLIERTEQAGATIAEPDAAGVLHELRSMHARLVGDLVALADNAEAHEVHGSAEGIPSVTAVGATLWLAAGHPDRAELLVTQLMARGIEGIDRDVDFLLNVTCIVEVAAALEMSDVARDAAAALRPYAGLGVLNAGAVTFHGVVDDYLYRAGRVVGDVDCDRWRHAAQVAYHRVGARWWERALDAPAPSLQAPPRRMCLRRDAEGRWSVGSEGACFELGDLKGLHYLRLLVQRQGTDVNALALSDAVAGHPGASLEQPDVGDVLDAAALHSYRGRLAELEDQLGSADRRGDQAGAARLSAERDAIVEQLRGAAGLGGRSRVQGASSERARVAVRKAIATALTQIAGHAPDLARLLRAAVHTGVTCRYDPDPERTIEWITD